MKRIPTILLLTLLLTPVTEVSMPNPATQTPARWESYDQMKRHREGLRRHGLTGRNRIAVVEIEGGRMSFHRDGRRCRL
jgi:hypothetical protein